MCKVVRGCVRSWALCLSTDAFATIRGLRAAKEKQEDDAEVPMRATKLSKATKFES